VRREENVSPRNTRYKPAPVEAREGRRLGRGERIRRGSDYTRVYDSATAVHGRLCVVFVLRDENQARRAGFVAGRRVGGAFQRNRVRRLLREAYRNLKQSLPERGVQLVFVAKAACPRHPCSNVMREMGDLLKRAGVL